MFTIHSLTSFFSEVALHKNDGAHHYPEDIFYQLSYLELLENDQEGDIYIACYRDNNGEVYYPFVKRKILFSNDISSEPIFDIITPFEYGGPVLFPEDNYRVMDKFFHEFDRYCATENIISEFIRVHPFLCKSKWLTNGYELVENCQNIYVDLSLSVDTIFASFSAATRRSIRVAKKQAVTIENTKLEHCSTFKNLYLSTMKRLKANKSYYFSNHFFTSLEKAEKKLFKIYSARNSKGNILASILIIGNGDIAHYFLGGRAELSRQEYAGNDYLFFKAIKAAKTAGYKYFHLGGAGKGQTGLLRFKKGFSKNRAPYYTARKIHNPSLYQLLVSKNYSPSSAQSNFFPAYRN